MATENHYRQLEQLFQTARIQEFYTNSTLSVTHERAELTLPADARYFHGAGAVHGSVYFKLLDDAAWFAAASVARDYFIVTISFQLHLLRPVSSGMLRAVGTVRSVSRSLILAEATLYNERGKEIAIGSGQFSRTSQLITDLDGYKLPYRPEK